MANAQDKYDAPEVMSPCFSTIDFYQKRKKGKYRLALAPHYVGPIADTHCHVEMLEKPEWAFVRAALHGVDFLCCVIDSVDDGPAGIKLVEDAYTKANEMLPDIIDQVFDNEVAIPELPHIIKVEDEPELCLDKQSLAPNPIMPDLRFIIGAHPHYAKDFDDAAEAILRQMLTDPRACCVGEIGLDFHYDLSPRDDQVVAFKRQLAIAKELGFPVSLHLREAHDVALQVFDEVGFDEHGTLLHCFNLASDDLKPWVDAGCYVAIGGPVTFKKSDDLRAAVKLIPQDKLLSETDAPFMTPEPVRGDTCFPDHVVFNADIIADSLHSDDKASLYRQMMQNARTLLDGSNPLLDKNKCSDSAKNINNLTNIVDSK